jgi:hypothetical protein
MSQCDAGDLQKPRTDDRVLWDIARGRFGTQALLIAYELKLFPLLGEQPRTLAEVCAALQIARRPAEALLIMCVSLGLVHREAEQFSLTPVAEEYLLDSSPTYFGGFLDMQIANQAVGSLDPLKQAMRTNTSPFYGDAGLFTADPQHAARVRTFTRAMHSQSMGPALAWPDRLNLAQHRVMLDIGGGSGAHAIGATRRWPDLQAIVLDRASVCEVAAEYIARFGMASRIQAQVGDMWQDPFPPADLHFYSAVYHDWSPEKCRFLTQKSVASLVRGGRIIIHEMLYNDEKTGPVAAAADAMAMLLHTEGQPWSGRELAAMLAEVGVTDIEVRATFGYWSIVTGRKP